VTVEDLKISPFLGYPLDKDIVSQFNEPDLAARIKSVWGDEEDRADDLNSGDDNDHSQT
jgi:hypothetical protein